MKQHAMNRRFSPASLKAQGGVRTVLLRMAEDQDRAARIGELKERNPLLTWAKIAREVGVTESAATRWRKTGALKPEHAELLAQVFNVDFDYIWSGPRPETPDMFVDRRNSPSAPVAVDRLDGPLEDRIGSIEGTLAGIDGKLDAATSERQAIADLLAQQTELLGKIEAATQRADDATVRIDGIAKLADQAAKEAVRRLEALQAATPTASEVPHTTAK